LLTGLTPRFLSSELRPPPHQVFPAQQARAAMHHLPQAQRIGKLIVAITAGEIRRTCGGLAGVRAEATYLITGGLGGLGLRVAQSLIERGARHLVLSSRGEPDTPEQTGAIRQMAEAGADVHVLPADVSKRSEIERLLETIRTTLPPLRGVVHAAGVLEDGMLRLQRWERFEHVMRPKIAGAWHLHRLTEELDFFVLFSSGVGLIGAHGQGSYAAANAFLDSLAQHRRGSGLPALSIAWGPWADLGMTAKMDRRGRKRMAEIGLLPIAPADALEAFELLLSAEQPMVAALRVEWARLAGLFPPPPLWADLARSPAAAGTDSSALLEHLRNLPTADAREALIEHLRGEVAAVLAWNSSTQIGLRQKFFDLGMDSLTSVELRQRLERSLGSALPLTVAFDYPNIEALSKYIAQQLQLFEEDSAPTSRPASAMDAQAARLAEMSDQEVEMLLAKKVKELM
jgi:NAD(P)-dependent dehydrogenase (short-subunit alcohol dehydrogenase family)/acyl carrier protein